ncbi:hypothetical protein L596_009133 [Steinernema carpocapsae]|uniref:Sushi domain-containing protein n=1 Tax=Steinernema carpocapsae TaxID=34508 RepID=A0A4U5PFA5_STECR|nr:hypothetical protein L596_009133 [Steinernema carpocapsae]
MIRLTLVLGLCWAGITVSQHCAPLLPIPNGEFKYAQDNEVIHGEGATATLVCEPGAALSGLTNKYTCRGGQWLPPVDTKCLKLIRAGTLQIEHLLPKWTSIDPHVSSSSRQRWPGDLFHFRSRSLSRRHFCHPSLQPRIRPSWKNDRTMRKWPMDAFGPVQKCPELQINYIAAGNGPYDYGAIAQLSCNLGYTAVGANSVTCEPTGWGPFPGLGSCQKGIGGSNGPMCPSIQDTSAMISYLMSPLGATQHSQGATAIINCIGGMGNSVSSCQNGNWSPSPKPCSQNGGIGGIGTLPGLQCFAMPMVFNGNINYSQGGIFGPYPQGTSASLQCNPGSNAAGQTQANCQNGAWNPPTLGPCDGGGLGGIGTGVGTGVSPGLQCIAMNVASGTVQYSQSGSFTYPPGAQATITCNPGTNLVGSSQSTCRNGGWDPAPGTCNMNGLPGIGGTTGGGQNCIFDIAPPMGGTVRHDRGEIGPFPEGTTATASCGNGALQGVSSSTCRSGAWNPPMFGTCSLGGIGGVPGGIGSSTCLMGVFPQPAGSTITYSGPAPYQQGTTATMQCVNGRQPQGQTTATCQNGVFTPLTGTCDMSIGGVGAPGVPGVGVGTGTPGAASCIFGHLPLGGTVEYSQGNIAPYQHNSQANLRCNAGYSPQGATQSTCQNGVWTPALGTCLFGGNGVGTGVGTGIMNNGNNGNSQSPCHNLPVPGNGQIRYNPENPFNPGHYEVGTTASIQCDFGYIPSSQSTVTCRQEGWSNFFVGNCQPMSNAGNTG